MFCNKPFIRILKYLFLRISSKEDVFLQILRLQNNQLSLNSTPEPLLADSQVSNLLVEGNLFEIKVKIYEVF